MENFIKILKAKGFVYSSDQPAGYYRHIGKARIYVDLETLSQDILINMTKDCSKHGSTFSCRIQIQDNPTSDLQFASICDLMILSSF